MTITLSPETEIRLRDEASKRGVSVEQYLQKLVEQALPPVGSAQSLDELFKSWEREDPPRDQKDLEERNAEVEQLLTNLNRNRRLMEGPNSRPPAG